MRQFITFCILIVSQISFAQTNKSLIPFKLTSANNIVIKAIINKIDTVQLMLHTAADDVTLTEEATKKLKSLSFDKKTDVVKSWGGQSAEARQSENNLVEVGDLKFDSLTITENKNSGPFTDGKFGLDLLKNKVVEINFEKKVIIVSEKLPKHIKKYKKQNIEYDFGFLFLDAVCEIEKGILLKNKYLIHSGYSGTILLDDKFTSDNHLNEKLKVIDEKELKDSYGNVLKTKKAIMPNFKIGNSILPDIPVGFFTGAIGNQKMSIIGGDILKRFNWVIDAKREFIYLKPNNYFKEKHMA